MARDDMTPPLSFPISVVELEGKSVVVAEIPAAESRQRPVYVTARGVTTGSYLRSGDGDRRLSQDEIGLLYAAKAQPRFDLEPVAGTSLADLDRDAVAQSLQRVRANVSSFHNLPDVQALHRLLVLAENREDSPLTLAGLLVFGLYPQQFFPQLMVSIVASSDGSSQTRFDDNAAIRGPIPRLVDDALSVVRRNVRVAAVMTGRGRVDRPDFPLDAAREAIVNALLHRDYSPITRGTQVQVEITLTEISVRSPGGLYGISVDALGFTPITSSRNSALASLLPDAFLPASREVVAENRASGIPAMMRLAREWGLPRPRFQDSPASFLVRMPRMPLVTPSVQAWIRSLGLDLPTPEHEMALAMLRVEPVSTIDLRLQAETDARTANGVLRDLTSQGAAIPRAGRLDQQFVLAPALRPTRQRATDKAPSPSVVGVLQANGWITAAELSAATGLARPTVTLRLRRLLAEGRVEADGAARSPKRRYRWIGGHGMVEVKPD